MKTPSETVENRFIYDGRLGKVFGIWLKTLLLSIITLGIYGFWGKTNLRKYVADSFSLSEDRFEYTGTGAELFRGFLKALLVIFLYYIVIVLLLIAALNLTSSYSTFVVAQFLIMAVAYFVGIYFVFLALYMGIRYIMSRILWRGVRGKLSGSAFSFAKYGIFYLLIAVFTLGICAHYANIMLYKRIIEKAQFGNAKFNFDGKVQPLFGLHLLTLLLAIPTLGLSRFWYRAAFIRYRSAHTTVDNLRLKATHTGASLFFLNLVNLLIIIFTLGLGTPIVIQRRINYFAENMSILGDIDTSEILQSDEKLGKSGEGLASALDLDIGLM